MCCVVCTGMILLSACAADPAETATTANNQTNQLVKAEVKSEPVVAEKTIIKETPPPAPVKEKPRKLHKGSSYFNFAKESSESKVADFVDSPKEKAPQSFPLDKVVFRDNNAKLTKDAKKQLENISKIMAAYYGVKVDLYVHAGGGAKTLAKKRATAIKEYFIKKGLNGQRINIVGKSEGSGKQGDASITITSK